MPESIAMLVDTAGFPPRWVCGHWTAAHGWLHVVSDLAVFGAYMAIPGILAYLVRSRRDLPFPVIFWLFCGFILSCGLVHLVEATIFWYPWYRLSGLIKGITAIVSWATVFALVPTLKTMLELPGLASVNAQLQREIEQRRIIEADLERQTRDLERDNDELEAFSRAVVHREARVIELKVEVNRLLEELGRRPRYASVDHEE